MKKIKLFSFAFMFVLLGISSKAQTKNEVSGSVFEKNTTTPVIGATIIIEGTNKGTTTDADGNFKLESNTSFPWKLKITSIGYLTNQITINSPQSNLKISLDSDTKSLDEVVVSASRKAEKKQNAPASVSIISSKTLQAASSAIDPLRELANIPGVQIQQQSAARMNIEMRGGANLFDTNVFPILDYRSLVGPGIGTFQSDASGLNSIDLQKIEVVRGPASALYGPGVTSGVVHFMSKSPIDYPGTTIELIGGTMSTYGLSFRQAFVSKSKKLGVKFNGHYKRGDEFSLDGSEGTTAANGVFTSQLKKFKQLIVDPIVNNLGVVASDQTGAKLLLAKNELDPDGDGNMMSDYWQNASINSTLEYRPNTHSKIVGAAGYNQVHSVFYNSQGEGLYQQHEYWGQVRYQNKGFFAQTFYVNNDGGTPEKPTFLYQTGNRTPVGRTQLEGQAQYNFGVKKLLNADFTTGVDFRLANSDSEHKVYGRNEDDDKYQIMGAYLQGKFELTNKLDMVLASRLDKFNFIEDIGFSPRIAFVYKASPNHSFRASYNKAISAVSTLINNIDFPVATPAAGKFDVWLHGSKDGQQFAATPMIDLTMPGAPDLPYGIPGLPLAIPYGAVTPNILTALSAGLPAASFALIQPILTNPANAPKGTTGTFTGYNLFTGKAMAPVNTPKTGLKTTTNFEIGYTGTINKKLKVNFDVYQYGTKGFTEFTAISPTIRFTNTSLSTDLSAAVQKTVYDGLIAQNVPVANATALAAVVGGAYKNGGDSFSTQIAPLSPIFGAVETVQMPVDGMVHNAAGYRVFGDMKYFGSDLGLNYLFNDDLSAFFNYSWLNQTEFTAEDLGEDPNSGLSYQLNVPQNKVRMGMIFAPEKGFRGNISYQYDESFYASYGQYTGNTDPKNLFDAGIGYKTSKGISFDITCTNLLDRKYRAFVNMPEIGRRAIAKITYSF